MPRRDMWFWMSGVFFGLAAANFGEAYWGLMKGGNWWILPAGFSVMYYIVGLTRSN